MNENLTNGNGQMLKDQQNKQEMFVDVNSENLGDMLIDDFNFKSSPDVPITYTETKNNEVGQSVKQETKGLDSLAKNQEDIDRFYQTNIDKQWTMWDKMTNRSMYNQVQQVKQELFQTSASYRLKFYKTMLDTRLEYLNEKCNAGIKMVKGYYRHQVSSYLMSKMEQLSFEVRDRQFAFLDMMKGKYAYSESLTAYPSMKQRYMESVFTEEAKYLRFLDGLLDKFQSIVDEELRKYN